MTIELSGVKVSGISMDSNNAATTMIVPDEFWDELQDLIDVFDIAFDEELIQLKEQESDTVIGPESTVVQREPKTQLGQIVPVEIPKHAQHEPVVPADDGLIIGTRRPTKPVHLPIASTSNGLPVGCEPISQESTDEIMRAETESKSSTESSVSYRDKKKHKKESKSKKSKKDKKKSKKRRRSRSRSSSSDSLEKIYKKLRQKLKDSDLHKEILKSRSPSPVRYEPFKINLPDLNFKPVQPAAVLSYPGYGATAYGYKRKSPAPSTSSSSNYRRSRSPDRHRKSPGYGAVQLRIHGSPSKDDRRSPSPFEPFISGPMELIIPKSPVKEEKRRKSFSRSPSYKGSRRSPPRRRSRSISSRRDKKGSDSPKRRKSRSISYRRSKSSSRSVSPALPYRIRRSPSYAPYERKKSPVRKKYRSRTPSPIKNRRARNRRKSPIRMIRHRSRDSTASSLSDRSKSSKLRSVSPRGPRNRNYRKSSTVQTTKTIKPVSEDENWDDLVESAPKAPPTGYDIDAVKKKLETNLIKKPKRTLIDLVTIDPDTDIEKNPDVEAEIVKDSKEKEKSPSIVILSDEEYPETSKAEFVDHKKKKNREKKPLSPKKPVLSHINEEDDDWDELVETINVAPPSSYDLEKIKAKKFKVNVRPSLLSTNLIEEKTPNTKLTQQTIQRENRAKSEDGELSNSPTPSPTKVRGASPISDEDEQDIIFDDDKMELSDTKSDEEQPVFCGKETKMETEDTSPKKKLPITQILQPLPPGIEPEEFEIPVEVPEIFKATNTASNPQVLLPPGIEPSEFEPATVSSVQFKTIESPDALLPPGVDPEEFISHENITNASSLNNLKPEIEEKSPEKSDSPDLTNEIAENIESLDLKAQHSKCESMDENVCSEKKEDEETSESPAKSPSPDFAKAINEMCDDEPEISTNEVQNTRTSSIKSPSPDFLKEIDDICTVHSDNSGNAPDLKTQTDETTDKQDKQVPTSSEIVENSNENTENSCDFMKEIDEICVEEPLEKMDTELTVNESEKMDTETVENTEGVSSTEQAESLANEIQPTLETSLNECLQKNESNEEKLKKSSEIEVEAKATTETASSPLECPPSPPQEHNENVIEENPNVSEERSSLDVQKSPESDKENNYDQDDSGKNEQLLELNNAELNENISEEQAENIPEIDPLSLIPDDEIKESQDADMLYSRIKECLIQNYPPTDDIRFLMEEYQPMALTDTQLLYRENEEGIKLKIIPEPLIQKVIDSLHIINEGRHISEAKTLERAEKLYFWPFMSDTVHDYIINCKSCSGKSN